MNREQMIKDRDAYLAKIKPDVESRYPDAFNFYDKPANYEAVNGPDYKVKENSRKPLSKSKSVLTDAQLMHLLKRVKPGISPVEYNAFKGLDVAEIVDMLLTETTLEEPINNYNNGADIIDPEVPFGETYVYADYNNYLEGERIASMKSWFVKSLVEPSTSMQGTMRLFWHNHMPTEMWGIFNSKFSYKYHKLLHDYSFGNFKEFVYEMCINPAMIIYLNTFANSKEAPDENFGRELQELFTIGKGPDAEYTEGDVQAAARIMTGWNLDWDSGEPLFYWWNHEESDKQFSEFYGNKVITGKSGEAGAEELQEMIDMIFENNEVAPYICRKLYTYFCFATIDEWTEENIIQPLAEIFRDNDYSVKPVLEALFTSDHFYDEVNYGAIIKTPVDVLLGWWRSMEVQMPFEASDIHNDFLVYRSIYWSMSTWGMELGDPPNVAGWPAFYQFPTFDKSWVTTSTIVRRIQFVDAFIYWGFWSPNYVVTYDILDFVKSMDAPSDPNALIQQMEDWFLGISLNESIRFGLKSILLSGQAEDYYWTNAWNAYISNEDDEEAKSVVFNRLRYLFQRIFNLSEFQLK